MSLLLSATLLYYRGKIEKGDEMNNPDDDDHLPIVDQNDPVIMNIDYFDLAQVKVLAKRLALSNCESMSVVKHDCRANFNIVRTNQEGELPPTAKVIWRTK